MTSAGKVAEIFSAAGEAFTRLGTLAMHLQPLNSEKDTRNNENGKWGDEEIEQLKEAVYRFGQDLEKISLQIKTKSLSQIKSALKQKALKELGKDHVIFGENNESNGTTSKSGSSPSTGKTKSTKSSSSETPPKKKQKLSTDQKPAETETSITSETGETSVNVES